MEENDMNRRPTTTTLTISQLAETLQISRNTAYALANKEGFPAFRIGKRMLVNREMLQAWMNQQCA